MHNLHLLERRLADGFCENGAGRSTGSSSGVSCRRGRGKERGRRTDGRLFYIAVPRPSGSYCVEIGYYQPVDVWHSVAISDKVRMPPDQVAAPADFDLVTIPFHLGFQRLLDLLGAANGDALAEIVSQFQKRALSNEVHKKLSPEEREVLRAMDLSLSEIAAARSEFSRNADSETLRKRTEALLSLGQTSSSPGFGGRM